MALTRVYAHFLAWRRLNNTDGRKTVWVYARRRIGSGFLSPLGSVSQPLLSPASHSPDGVWNPVAEVWEEGTYHHEDTETLNHSSSSSLSAVCLLVLCGG